MMRTLLVGTYDNHGGAARASSRLLQGLGATGADVRMVVKAKGSDNPLVAPLPPKEWSQVQKKLFQLKSLLLNRRQGGTMPPPGFSVPVDDFLSADLAMATESFQPDLVHLHWISNDFLSLSDLARIQRPILWTLHDSWAFTGGCHVPDSCTSYMKSCGCCPLLNSDDESDLSSYWHQLKSDIYTDLPLTIVTPSHWMAQKARKSSLLKNSRIEVIPNGLDMNQYRPVDKQIARQLLGLPLDRSIILFGGMGSTSDPNKGFDLLINALSGLSQQDCKSQPELVVFGACESAEIEKQPLPCRFLGTLRDDLSLVLVYSAADVMVVPSRQENLVQTAVEAMSCGTPVVAFRASGTVDIVDHLLNGYLAEPYDTRDLRDGILWALSSSRNLSLGAEARRKAEHTFSLESVVARYSKLYNEAVAV